LYLDLIMQVALVIGASRGIGRQIALSLSSKYLVVCCSKTLLDLETLSSEITITSNGGKCEVYQCDVRSAENIAEVVNQTMAKYQRIDVLVYNAGAIWWGPVEKTPLKRFQLMQDININGLYATIQLLLPIFKTQGRGRMIVVSPPIYSRFFRGKTAYAVGKVYALLM
jgi:NAD(P)-dependent dehydrogenase (short-subunit alcohol dehydrogenase family)